MNRRPMRLTMAAAAAACLWAGSAQALTPKAPPKGKQAPGAPKGGACPAANKVNTPPESKRGCTGSFLQGTAAKSWVPATEAEYLAQIASSTTAFNAANGKTFKPQGKSSYVPGAGNGGIRCPKYYKYKPAAGAAPIALHRVYDSGKTAGGAAKDGKYWTFNDEQWQGAKGPEYRKRYAICTGWNDLARHVGCKLKPGTVVAAGPGESLSKHLDGKKACSSVCASKPDESYKTSTDVQVVLHNPSVLCEFTP